MKSECQAATSVYLLYMEGVAAKATGLRLDVTMKRAGSLNQLSRLNSEIWC